MGKIQDICNEKRIKLTDQRKVIVNVLENSNDHPDIDEIYLRASKIDSKIGIATVYRTIKILRDSEVIQAHDFRDGRSRYEGNSESHHHHLIDVDTGQVFEFQNEKLEEIKKEIAKELGYELVDHRLELYGVAIKND